MENLAKKRGRHQAQRHRNYLDRSLEVAAKA